jgi:hypothetical protein
LDATIGGRRVRESFAEKAQAEARRDEITIDQA